jgi:TrmH family RNA methyltransferase
MPTQAQLDRVVLVLVRARNPNNIGAVARAMHDFGFPHLRLVNDYAVPFQDARSAVDASAVLASAVELASVAEAVADCTLVIGTTAVGARALDHPLHELPHAAALLRTALTQPTARIALLFGSEKTGLSNEELSHCHWLLTIPMHQAETARHPSMNLGQAAAVCLFELVRSELAPPIEAEEPQPPAGDLERLTHLLTTVLDRTGYTRRHPANASPEQVRRLVRRLALSSADAPVWMGILRQVLWSHDQQPTILPKDPPADPAC